MCTRLSEMCRHVHKVIRNITWDMCTVLSEMWQACAQGYQKCDMRCVQGYQKCDMEVWTGLSEMLHEASVQGSQKCDTRHEHRVTRNVTWKSAGLSEMWQETCVQGYQKCGRKMHRVIEMWHEASVQFYQKWDVRHVHRVTRNMTRDVFWVKRNVTWGMCTGL